MLGLRAIFKPDIEASPAELVYGTNLRLPSDFFADDSKKASETEIVQQLRKVMRDLRPVDSAWHGRQSTFIHPDLLTCDQVFVRDDTIRPSLTAPYIGPCKVIRRLKKVFIIDINGRIVHISLDRLKPAYVLSEPQ